MQKFGLIGKVLTHSYSKKIHPLLGAYQYDKIELLPEQLKDFVQKKEYAGYNVTIPYKKDIIPFLDFIDENAKKIGAINTVVNRGGKLYGYNTDFDGMIYALKRAGIILKNKIVLILGSGGTSNTATAVAERLGAFKVKILSRSGQINYENYKSLAGDAQIIINTTPVGTYPDNYSCLIDLKVFKNLEGVMDVVYNPALSKLLCQAKELGVPYSNGFPMLVAQAKRAAELFFDKTLPENLLEDIIKRLQAENLNIVLVGMPGCGKTTVGKELEKLLGKEFVDTDELIEKKVGKSIPQIFADNGEEYFRKIESEVLAEVGKLSGKIISTGGGVIKNKNNYFPLKQNGVIVWVKRDIERLVCDGRPLSKDLDTVKKLYEERKDNYEFFADEQVDNDGEINSVVKEIVKLYENFGDKRA